MGEVYRAFDARLGREVAVKILPDETSGDSDSVSRFEKEARAVASLSHPAIVPLFDVGEQHGVRYVVTELVEGETLRARLAAGPLPPADAAEIAAQVADGLAAAHSRGLVHRDIKPENIILARGGGARILDFGLVRRMESPHFSAAEPDAETQAPAATEVGTVAGTVGYMSPEQIRGEPPDGRSDIFSLGAVLYEMLKGRRAFAATSRIETLSAILKEDPELSSPSDPDVPDSLNRILRRCLAKKPEARYHSAADLAHDLRAAASEGSRPGPDSSPRVLPPASRRRAAPFVLLAAAAVIALAAVAVFLLPRLRGRPAPGRVPATLAVLPFRGIGSQASLEQFGLGLADSLIGRLATLRQLTVRPTSAIARYASAPTEAAEAGRALDVDAVLEGTFQKLEGTTRVSVQMTDVARGGILWSEQIDLPEGKLFELQDAISSRLVERLRVELGAGGKTTMGRSEEVPDATMEKYLAVRARFAGIALADLNTKLEIVRSLDEILRESPEFARALATRAYARSWVNFFSPAPSGYDGVVADARRAIALAPELAEPHVALASAYWSASGKWDVVSAVRELNQAAALAPGLEVARLDLVRIYQHYGWMPESQAQLDAARRINPGSAEVLQHQAFLKSRSGDHRGALLLYERLPPGSRASFVTQWQMAWDRLMVEDPSRVLPDIEALSRKSAPDDPLVPGLLALARVRAGKPDIAELEQRILAADSQRGHFHHALHFLAGARAQRKDAAGAVALLEKAADLGLACPICFEKDAMIDPVRGSPEYTTFEANLARRVEGYRASLKGIL